jgi:hypothetical protein
MSRTKNQARKPAKTSVKTHAPKKTSNKQWWRYIPSFIVTFALLIATTIGGNVLNGISTIGGFILFVSCLCIIFGYWTWVFIGWLRGRGGVAFTTIRIISTAVIIFVLIFSAPYYINIFIKNQGSIEMPTFRDNSTQVLVKYGSGRQAFWTQITVGELEQEGGQVPLKIDGYDVFKIHIDQNKLYIDTSLFAGIKSQSNHIFYPPVVITNNEISEKPDGWKIYENNMNLEIDNENGIPVLIMEYKNPYSIIISGLFVTPMGICKVDNENGSGYVLGDTLTQLGGYKVDNLFIHSIFDLFRRERTYNLANF